MPPLKKGVAPSDFPRKDTTTLESAVELLHTREGEVSDFGRYWVVTRATRTGITSLGCQSPTATRHANTSGRSPLISGTTSAPASVNTPGPARLSWGTIVSSETTSSVRRGDKGSNRGRESLILATRCGMGRPVPNRTPAVVITTPPGSRLPLTTPLATTLKSGYVGLIQSANRVHPFLYWTFTSIETHNVIHFFTGQQPLIHNVFVILDIYNRKHLHIMCISLLDIYIHWTNPLIHNVLSSTGHLHIQPWTTLQPHNCVTPIFFYWRCTIEHLSTDTATHSVLVKVYPFYIGHKTSITTHQPFFLVTYLLVLCEYICTVITTLTGTNIALCSIEQIEQRLITIWFQFSD